MLPSQKPYLRLTQKAALLFAIFLPATVLTADHIVQIKHYKKRDKIIYSASYQSWRAPYAQWAFDVAKLEKLNPNSAALSMEIFDRFTQYQVISDSKVGMYFTASFVIAVKLIDKDKPLDFIKPYIDNFRMEDIQNAELHICNLLKWSVNFPVASNYIYVYFDYLKQKRLDEYMHPHTLDKLAYSAYRRCQLAVFRPRQGIESWESAVNCIMDAIHDERNLCDEVRDHLHRYLRRLFELK